MATNTGGILEDIPWVDFVGPEGDGFFGSPVPGQTVGLSNDMGQPYITFGYPPAAHAASDHPENDAYSNQVNGFLSMTGTNLVFHRGRVGRANHRNQRPFDLLSGDRGFSAPGGARVWVGRGGIAGMSVSELCQLILNQVDDSARLLARNFELMTDFGILKIDNTDGKTSLKLVAAKTAEQAWKGEYELVLTMGDGKAYIDVMLLKDGERVFTFKLDQKGNQHSFHAGDVIEQTKGHHGTAVGGHHKLSVGKSSNETVQEEKTIDVPKLHLGQAGDSNEPAVMGQELTSYLKELLDYLNNRMVLMVPGMGPTLPGALKGSSPAPTVPDFLSKVVDLTKTHTPKQQEEA